MKILTAAQAAERLGVSVRRVQQLVKAGRLPASEFGGSLMIQESDLALVEDRKPGRPRKQPAKTEEAKKKKKL
ncbi:MAG TPA: helix-turn-helix domain-containing protein [Blastocatellia bacterium]|nr:helix-turn-helix domain-containing protein [Blastocatellia bacterium]